MTADTQDDEPWELPSNDDDTPKIESLGELVRSAIDLMGEQLNKRLQVACCIYKLTRVNVTIPISVKQIIKATNLSEREVLGIVNYLLEQGWVACESILDLDVSFYITSKGITELEIDLNRMSKERE